MDKFSNAMKIFEKRDHKAVITCNTDRFLCIDWKRSDGSAEYAVYYVLDKVKGMLSGYGDLGEFVANWFNELNPIILRGFMKDVGYFHQKIRAKSNDYVYTEESVEAEIQEELNLLRSNYEYELEEAIGPWEYPTFNYREMEEEILKYNGNWQELDQQIINQVENLMSAPMYEVFGDPGAELHQRVYLWAAGYYMAINQLQERGEL